jgi:hypothetical protein
MKRVGLHVLVRIGVAALVIAAIAAVGTAQTSAQEPEIIVIIEELNGSGISGDATLTDNGDGTTTIDVLVDGATGDHPMHLHSGTCAELGDIVEPLTNVDAEGSSVTDIELPLADIQAAPHAINIHLSEAEISTYVACADVPTVATQPTADDSTDGELTIEIAELNGSGMSGDATLTDNGDGTTTIDVLVAGSQGDHPIHLHSGTCAELGDVIVPLTNVDAEGSSVTDVDVPLATIQDPEVGPHAINIHLSADEISTYVACGDIPLLAQGGETEAATPTAEDDAATATPATGVGPFDNSDNSIMIIMGMVAAVVVFAAGIGLRRGTVRA